jgi:hypothetical protein
MRHLKKSLVRIKITFVSVLVRRARSELFASFKISGSLNSNASRSSKTYVMAVTQFSRFSLSASESSDQLHKLKFLNASDSTGSTISNSLFQSLTFEVGDQMSESRCVFV